MSDQGLLFDDDAGKNAKQFGIETAALNRATVLEIAQTIALELGPQYGEVHADMVFRRLIARNISPKQLGPAAGAIFRGPHWEFTGRMHRSRRISNHARRICIWRYIP